MNVPQTDQLERESEERIAERATLRHSWANHKDGNNGNLYIWTARETVGYGFPWILKMLIPPPPAFYSSEYWSPSLATCFDVRPRDDEASTLLNYKRCLHFLPFNVNIVYLIFTHFTFRTYIFHVAWCCFLLIIHLNNRGVRTSVFKSRFGMFFLKKRKKLNVSLHPY